MPTTTRCVTCECTACLLICAFLATGVWQFSQGHFVSGAWMLGIAAVCVFGYSCKKYCRTPEEEREWQKLDKETECTE